MRSILSFLLIAVACNGSTTAEDSSTPEDVTGTEATTPSLSLSAGGWRLHEFVGSLPYVSWEQSGAAEAWVEYAFDGEDWRTSPRFDASAGSHEQILLGIPFGSKVRWRVLLEADGERIQADGETLITDPQPKRLPVATVTDSDPSAWEPTGNYLYASISQQTGSWPGGYYWTFIVDRQGRVVWANRTPRRNYTLFAQVAPSGDHLLWDENPYWGEGDTLVHRQTLEAKLEEIPADGLVHPFVTLSDGTLIWGSDADASIGEALTQRSPDGTLDVLWSCEEDYPGSPRAFCASNGLFYDAATDSLLISFWDESVVVGVDRATGDTLWWAGDVSGGYAFDPPSSQFDFQHGVSYTPAGTLLVHTLTENGVGVREYEVDHEAEVLRQIWSYGDGTSSSLVLNGDAWRLPGGNTLHTQGSAGRVNEVSPTGEVVWRLDFASERLMGRSTWIEDLYDLVPAPE